ncbi:MAG: type II toxin-antitoxin system PemK/MazF family toxin [Solirubrobacteraceae bacterium]
MASTELRRGDVWLVALRASRPGEPGKHRPAVLVSSDRVLAGLPDEPVVVVPLSRSLPPSAHRPEVGAGQGVERPSRAICGAVRGLARSRLLRHLGSLTPVTLAEVDRTLALVLGLD